jgi:hypothetical protein
MEGTDAERLVVLRVLVSTVKALWDQSSSSSHTAEKAYLVEYGRAFIC